MKKKIFVFVLVCFVTMFTMSGQAYAASDEIAPYFNVVSMANCSIASTDDGVEMLIWIGTPSSTSLDKVKIEVTLYRASGATAASYSQTMDQIGSTFIFDETAGVKVSSTYTYKYTAKCYKSGKLVDTVTGTSRSVYHSV